MLFLAWVQSPGVIALLDNTQWSRLETYVKDLVGTFANDARVLGWDVWNEPDNSFNSTQVAALEQLLPQVFDWARSANPTQPLTSGPFGTDYLNGIGGTVTQIQMNNSDVLSFHK